MALNRKGGTWEGGYVSLGAQGRKTYVIERRTNGIRFHISTRTHERRAALSHLDRFEKNATAYRPEGDGDAGALHINEDDIARYVKWSREARGNSREHVREVKRYLAHWIEDLGSVDWRGLKLLRLKAALDKRKTSRAYRIASIKAFCAWLREEEGSLTSEQDTTRDLASVQASPERQRHDKKVSKSIVSKLLSAVDADGAPLLNQRALDFLLIKASTGFHNTEIGRIARRDRASLEQLDEAAALKEGCPGVVRFLHKNGDMVPKRVESKELLDAFLRLSESGFTMRRVNADIKAACKALDLDAFTAGVLRHSWGTWHVEAGATIEAVAAGYNHKSKHTTERFYVQVAVPNRTVPPTTFESVH